MAVSRSGVAFVMLLVATAVVLADVTTAASTLCDFDCFLAHAAKEQAARDTASVQAVAVSATTSALPAKGRTITVDSKGKGDFKTIQAAINSVPNGNTKRVVIVIKDGKYKQKLRIVSQKPFIYFKCQSRKTIITWGDTAEKAGSTSLSASVAVESDGFIASDCTFVASGSYLSYSCSYVIAV